MLSSVESSTQVMMASVSGNSFKKIANAKRVVTIGVDSGAGVSVWPKEFCEDYPTRETKDSKAKVTYSGARSTSKPIVNEGERRIRLEMDGAVFGCRVLVAVRCVTLDMTYTSSTRVRPTACTARPVRW